MRISDYAPNFARACSSFLGRGLTKSECKGSGLPATCFFHTSLHPSRKMQELNLYSICHRCCFQCRYRTYSRALLLETVP